MNSKPGIYSDNNDVWIHGWRNGFTYITFITGAHSGLTCKVPACWVRWSLVKPA